jgi:outer membrane protein
MKSQFRSVLAVLAVAAAAVGLHAQPVLKVVTIDMDQLFSKYYKTEAQQAKMAEDEKKATDLRDSMLKERETLVGQAKELQEQATNALLNDEARKKAEADFQKKVADVRAKENEIQTFLQQTQQQMRAVWGQFQQQAFEEISKVATDIAKKKGATMVLNQGASTVVVFADTGFSITDEVLVVINKDRPAPAISITAPATPAATPAPAPKK